MTEPNAREVGLDCGADERRYGAAGITVGDVYIGDEPYDVLDDIKALRHVPCGEVLVGDDSRITHVCWFDKPTAVAVLTAWMAREGYDAGEVARAVEKPWNYRDEAERAGVA